MKGRRVGILRALLRCIPALAACGLLLSTTPAAAGDALLERPALTSKRAAASLMLAIARAGNRLVAAGERGQVVYSDDCGAAWHQAAVPVSVTLTALQFVDSRLGWAVGHSGVVLATRDGGATWTRQMDGSQAAQLALQSAQKLAQKSQDAAGASTQAADPKNIASQLALRDAERLVAEGSDKPLFALHFWTPQRGMVVGAFGLALSTADGGQTWEWMGDRIPNPKGLHLYALQARDEAVFMVGEQGFIALAPRPDGVFEKVASPYAGSFFGVLPTAPRADAELVLFGLRGNAFRGDGKAWSALDTGGTASLVSGLALGHHDLLLFNADSQVLRWQAGATAARKVATSPVATVHAAVPACTGRVALAGARGVAVVAASSFGAIAEKAEQP